MLLLLLSFLSSCLTVAHLLKLDDASQPVDAAQAAGTSQAAADDEPLSLNRIYKAFELLTSRLADAEARAGGADIQKPPLDAARARR